MHQFKTTNKREPQINRIGIRQFERNEILEIRRRFLEEAQIWGGWVCNCIPLWCRLHSKQVAARLTRLTPKPSCASSRPPVGFVQRFAPLIFSSYHTTQPSPPGPTVTTWRYGGGGVWVFYHYKMSLPGAWLPQTTCSPGSLWRGMFNSLIPRTSAFPASLYIGFRFYAWHIHSNIQYPYYCAIAIISW